jgi:phosphoribosylglycinamide formyltransferase-1
MTTRIGVLGSTRGSDLPAVVEAIKNGELKGLAEIVVVVSDVKESGILEKARGYGIPDIFVDPIGSDGQKKKKVPYNEEVAGVLDQYGADLGTMIGWMRLTSEWFANVKYKNRCMNIHPSLLPAFAGGMDLDVHQAVIERGCKFTGCTLMFIDEGADTGPIILQKVVPVQYGDTPDTLKAKVQVAEQEILVQGIKLYAQGRLRVEGKRVYDIGGR